MQALPALAGGGEGAMSIETLLLSLVAVILATKLLGELAQRAGQPAVLGELIAGVLLGALHLLDPRDPVIHALSELGVLILLFEIGLHTDLKSLTRVGAAASTVGLVGVVLPFAGGYLAMRGLDYPLIPSLVGGAALTATSIGISARVLSDLGRLGTPEGQVTLGAAVLDDIVGLVILAVIAGLVAGGGVDLWGVTRIAGIAVGFVVAAVVIGGVLIRPYLKAISRVRMTGALGLMALAVALGLAWAAARSGSAMIVGAFAAGVILQPTRQAKEISEFTTTLGHFFVPVFFAGVGAAVDVNALANPQALLLGGVLVAVGITGKVIAGFAPWWFKGDKLLVGVAMVPRGEVGLIFAQMGLTSGAIAAGEFGAIMLMVLATTFVTPPLLGLVAKRRPAGEDTHAQPGDGGIDDLVAGER